MIEWFRRARSRVSGHENEDGKVVRICWYLLERLVGKVRSVGFGREVLMILRVLPWRDWV